MNFTHAYITNKYHLQMLINAFGKYDRPASKVNDGDAYMWEEIKFDSKKISLTAVCDDNKLYNRIVVIILFICFDDHDSLVSFTQQNEEDKEYIKGVIVQKIEEQYQKLRANFTEEEESQYKLAMLHSETRGIEFWEDYLQRQQNTPQHQE